MRVWRGALRGRVGGPAGPRRPARRQRRASAGGRSECDDGGRSERRLELNAVALQRIARSGDQGLALLAAERVRLACNYGSSYSNRVMPTARGNP